MKNADIDAEVKDACGSFRVRTPPHGSARVRSMVQCHFSNFCISMHFTYLNATPFELLHIHRSTLYPGLEAVLLIDVGACSTLYRLQLPTTVTHCICHNNNV